MKILQNGPHRFNIDGVKDSGKTDKKGAVKTGIAGYQCKCLGWILEKVFHKAVGVKTENGTVYLNRKSFEQWVTRMDPEKARSDKDLEKLSRKNTKAERAIERIIRKQPVIVSKTELPVGDVAVKKFFGHLNDKKLFEDEWDQVKELFSTVEQLRCSGKVEFRIFLPNKDIGNKSKVVNVWVDFSENKPVVNIAPKLAEVVNNQDTPSKIRKKELQSFAKRMKLFVPRIQSRIADAAIVDIDNP